jgi:hypothetical protein
MDAVLHFIFFGLIEHGFFRFGRFVLRCATFGHVRLDTPTPFQSFVVALIGLIALILVVVGVSIAID